MMLTAVLQRVVPFLLGLAVGVLPAWLFSTPHEVPAVTSSTTTTYGKKYCRSRGDFKGDHLKAADRALRIEHKPKATYTEAARSENTTGTVVLRVEFLASGSIGEITPVRELDNGLTEAAIEAARGIEFSPAFRDGEAVTTVKQVEYTFSIY